ALTHEVEGTHSSIGVDICRRYHEPPEVLNAITYHHGEEEAKCIEAILVAAADAISASRPGARKETAEMYIKRLEGLERIATSFPGVEKAYAIQAGREVRVLVRPTDIDDLAAQRGLRTPGQRSTPPSAAELPTWRARPRGDCRDRTHRDAGGHHQPSGPGVHAAARRSVSRRARGVRAVARARTRHRRGHARRGHQRED